MSTAGLCPWNGSASDATTGDRPGVAVTPTRVVTLALPKTGLTNLGADRVLADIGLLSGVYERLAIPAASPFGDAYAVTLSLSA
ncbi:sugar kinase [Haloarcula sp. JP-L23]|uniref:sugar kinase n=1 Tax=Haloarcula sp. JP-L23 TaxID=2716717 RepID=UPI00140EBFBF|nr:sugar kinase [Haloarcula sp. JP-L23]